MIMLVFSARVLTFTVGCGFVRAGVGDRCNTHDGACDTLPECKDGLYCDFESSICETCDEEHCGSDSPPPYTPDTSSRAPDEDSAPPDETPTCSLVTTPSVLCNDDEATFYCHPGASTQPVVSCRPATTQYFYCCSETNDAGEDASDPNDE